MLQFNLTPSLLNWLASGQLKNRFQRAFRLWYLSQKIYQYSVKDTLFFQPFTYAQLREQIYSIEHPQKENITNINFREKCPDLRCLCHQSIVSIVGEIYPNFFNSEILQELILLTGFTQENLIKQLEIYPFATVHRSLRDDLKQLVNLGIIANPKNSYYQRILPENLPQIPQLNNHNNSGLSFSEQENYQLLNILESVAFLQPNLEILIDKLWQNLQQKSNFYKEQWENTQRIFLHFDYILPDESQEQIDNYQEQIEQIWQKKKGGIISFDYFIVQENKKITVMAYPVCFHYIKRAKYLSAYGVSPSGQIGWHNYRLDRICSKDISILPWGDPLIPKILKDKRDHGELPTSEDVKKALNEAWGFNFYLPKAFLIMRFSPVFARWYVENTQRHDTFQKVEFDQLFSLVKKEIVDPIEQKQILEIIQQKAPNDVYYQGYVRIGDINLLMRLRDWRPNGEVIAPLCLRKKLKQEAIEELNNYN
jgi:CRISPR-associated protein (TIGR03985 family)